ncbi:FHA domain-containing protein [Actinoplanes sp. NPDC049265]|uniref:FHA domain-containing protein n=1 Tax=Actinoplanes sp. NPDC049265 TaxID=3363902 RepID=UPI00371337B5
MTARTCVECGLRADRDEPACRICGGLVPVSPKWSGTGGETVALPSGGSMPAPTAKPGATVGDRLRVTFHPGAHVVEVGRGDRVALGRGAGISPYAEYLGRFEDVSRRHVTLRVDAAGRAFVRDEYSTNGTVRGGSRLAPGTEERLRDGDRIVLGGTLWGAVELLADEPTSAAERPAR